MTVRELILRLQQMPQHAEVLHVWDGEARTAIEHVWLSRSGCIVTADHGQVVYSPESRPVDAPDIPYWKTPDPWLDAIKAKDGTLS